MKKKTILLFMLMSMLFIITGCIRINVGDNGKSSSNSQEVKKSEKLESKESEESNNTKDENLDEDKNAGSKITIVIDPGHSSTGTQGQEKVSPNSSTTKLKDGLGAEGEYTKVPEHKTNMSVASYLKEELQSRGYNVVMTKNSVEESKSNIERAEVGNKNNADLVVRIHADSSENNSLSGASMHVPANNEFTSSFYKKSKSYGTTILDTYVDQVGMKNRGVIERDDLTGFNWSKVPVVLIEMGFLSNEQDDNFVSNTENHPKIAKAIADGVDKCFK